LPDSLTLDLDHDGRVTVAEYRKARKLPDAQQTLATLLLAGQAVPILPMNSVWT